MSSTDPIRRLRAVAAAAGLVDPELGRWLSGAIDAYAAGEKLERALGLAGPWRAKAARERRDAAIRELAERHLPRLPSVRATAIAFMARRDLLKQLGEKVSERTLRRVLRVGQRLHLPLAQSSGQHPPGHGNRNRTSFTGPEESPHAQHRPARRTG